SYDHVLALEHAEVGALINLHALEGQVSLKQVVAAQEETIRTQRQANDTLVMSLLDVRKTRDDFEKRLAEKVAEFAAVPPAAAAPSAFPSLGQLPSRGKSKQQAVSAAPRARPPPSYAIALKMTAGKKDENMQAVRKILLQPEVRKEGVALTGMIGLEDGRV